MIAHGSIVSPVSLADVATWICTDSQPGSGPRVAVKDLIDMAGLPTTAGSRAIADRAAPATRDAPCLAGLREAQRRGAARFVGKTNLHELAFGVTGINAAFGTPVNPLDPRRVPGGSSSGSAVAVAAGEADVAFGTDTGGSVRIPAACCGIAGLKTTWGRVSLDDVHPLAPGLDTVGPMARDIGGLVTGMALLEPGFTIAAEAPRTVGRLAIDADPKIDAAIAARCARPGSSEPVSIPEVNAVIAASLTVLGAAAWATNADLVRTSADLIGADVLDRLRRSSTITEADLAAARVTIAGWRAALDDLWRQVDVLAAPTLLGFPALLEDAATMMALRGLTSPVNAAGVPSLAMPVPADGPLPGEHPADRPGEQRGPAARGRCRP